MTSEISVELSLLHREPWPVVSCCTTCCISRSERESLVSALSPTWEDDVEGTACIHVFEGFFYGIKSKVFETRQQQEVCWPGRESRPSPLVQTLVEYLLPHPPLSESVSPPELQPCKNCWCSPQIPEHTLTLATPRLQQRSPLLEWEQLELVLSHPETDWRDNEFSTTSLSTPRVISVSCLQAFNKSGGRSRSPTGLYLTGRVSP